MKSKVWFMDDSGGGIEKSLANKLKTLFDEAGFANMIEKGDRVVIKLHMGELGNTMYLRPVYVRSLVEKIKEAGGDPVIMDNTTLPYFGMLSSRAIREDEELTVERHGFVEKTCGAPVIIGDCVIPRPDGGYDASARAGSCDVKIDIPEGNVLKEQYIGRGEADADVLIALTHFKGHPMGVYGGSIKNIGVGAASKRGKHNLHMGGHPLYNGWVVNHAACMGKNGCDVWEACEVSCPVSAKKVIDDDIIYDPNRCVTCLACMFSCPSFVFIPKIEAFEATPITIADSAKALVKTKKQGKVAFINMAIDITPWCDCIPWSDRPIIPNIGIFASYDPVAIDQACLDKAKASGGMPGSNLQGSPYFHSGHEKFTYAGGMLGVPETQMVEAGRRNGLGSREYELVEVKQPVHITGKVPLQYTIVGVSGRTDPLAVAKELRELYTQEAVIPEEGFERDNRHWREIWGIK